MSKSEQKTSLVLCEADEMAASAHALRAVYAGFRPFGVSLSLDELALLDDSDLPDAALVDLSLDDAFALAIGMVRRGICVVLLADLRDEEAEARCQEIGAAGLVRKSFYADQLMQRIRDIHAEWRRLNAFAS